MLSPTAITLYQDNLVDLHYTDHCAPIPNLHQPQIFEFVAKEEDYHVEETDDGLLRLVPEGHTTETCLKRVKRSRDGRTRIDNTHDLLYRPHGWLKMKFADGDQTCSSGVLIGPHHVLTAGHNVYRHKHNCGWAIKIMFTPARNEDEQPFGKAQGTILLSFKGWVNHQKAEDDIGLVILDDGICYKTDWAGLFSAPDSLLKDQTIHVTGYPGDKCQKATQMWTLSHKPKRLTVDTIEYDIDTFAGQSGSAVWAQLKDYSGWHVIGIHAYGISNDEINDVNKSNQGTRLSAAKITQILAWLETYQHNNMLHPNLPNAEDNRKKTAVNNFKQRVKNNEAEAQYALDDYYHLNKQLADNTDKLKQLYYIRQGKRFYYQKAFKLYQKAANQDNLNALALWMVGECYLLGRGIEANLTKALAYYQKAAAQNNPAALCSIGVLYDNGQGVTQDYTKAIEWYRKATALGELRAEENLRSLTGRTCIMM